MVFILRVISIALLLLSTAFSILSRSTETSAESVAAIEKDAEELSRLWNRDSINAAARLFQTASAQWRSLNDSESASRALQESARLSLLAGDNHRAIRELLLAVKLAEDNNHSIQRPRALSYLSLAFLKIGDKNKSKHYLDQAFSASEGSADKFSMALSHFAAGEFSYWQTDNDKALQHYSAADRLSKEIGESRLRIDTLISTAYIYMVLGKASEGLRYAREAEGLATAIENERSIALSRIACGHLASFMNEKQSAIEYYSKAAKQFPDDLDFTEKGALLNGLGAIYEHYEELGASLDYRLQALENFKKDKFLFGYLSTLHSVIGLCFQLGRDSEAATFIREAQDLSNRLNDTYYSSLVSRTIGDYHFSKKDDERAVYYYRRSLKATESIGYKTNGALIHNKLGQIDLRRNDLTSARRHFEAALSISAEIRNLFAASESYYHLAVLEDALKKEVASDLARKSIEATELLYSDVANANLKRTYFSNIYERYGLYTRLLMQTYKASSDKTFAIDAMKNSERSRARAMTENLTLSEAKFLADGDPLLVEKEKALQLTLSTKLDALVELIRRKVDANDLDQTQRDIHSLERQLEDVRTELKQSSPIYSAIKNPEPFDLADFQANVLDENSLLLEFSLGAEASYLWAVDKRDVTAYYLPPREQVEARVEKLRSLLGGRQLKQGESLEEYQERVAAADVEYRSEARALSNDLLGQAADKLVGKKLIVVADGRLHYFPLGSLPMPGADDDAPILLTNEVVYTPSASTLKILRMKKNIETGPQKDLLVFADPVFSRSDERIAGGDAANTGFGATVVSHLRSIESLESMPRLPASEEEARSISKVVGANQTTVRSGFAASRDGVLNGGIENYKILHFATHGLIDEKRPELSGILLSLYTDEGKQNDGGFLRLQDVYGLRLNSDLVVLSACDTGIGKEIKGEGVMSLNNAFLQAGAKSVVSSLWKVDDTATKDLMTEFYRGMTSDDLTAAAALRQAQIKMYNDPRYRSPFYWAAFTASGDTAVKVVFTSYTRLYATITIAIIFAASGVFLAFRRYRRHSRSSQRR